MQRGGKKRVQYEKNDFSDEQISEQIRDQIRQIRQSARWNQIQKIQKIAKLYREQKQNKKRKKIAEKGTDKKQYSYGKKVEVQSQSEQSGQINEHVPTRRQRQLNEQHMSMNQLAELIRQVTLTRKKLIDFLDNRKFQDLVKGCFVRYKCDSNSKQQAYIIAQIIGVKQGTKEYTLAANQKTKVLLVLQQSSLKVVDLPIQMVSNQTNSGSLQINKWIQQNSDKIPKERQFKDKIEQHRRLNTEQLSSQEIDKNIENRAVALARRDQQIKSYEDLQNLIDFICEKIDNYIVLEEQQIAKRKQDKLQLIQIRRKIHEYQQVRKSLEQKKRQYLQNKGQGKDPTNDKGYSEQKQRHNRAPSQLIRIQQKRQDSIKQKWKLRQMLLCTAEGYERIRVGLLETHADFEIQIMDV